MTTRRHPELLSLLTEACAELGDADLVQAHGCDAVAVGDRPFALIAADGRIGVRLPDWDLFAAAYELPGSEPLFENERARRPLGAAARRMRATTPPRCASGWAMRMRSRQVACERGARTLVRFGRGGLRRDARGLAAGAVRDRARALRRARAPRHRRHRRGHRQAHAHARAARGHARRGRARRRPARRAAARAAGAWRCSTGTAEALPLADESADAACAGQAFHWFDVDRALDEIARVLRPEGVAHRRLEPCRPRTAPGTTRSSSTCTSPIPTTCPRGRGTGPAGARGAPALSRSARDRRAPRAADRSRGVHAPARHAQRDQRAAAGATRGADRRGASPWPTSTARSTTDGQRRNPVALRALRAAAPTRDAPGALEAPGYTVPVTETALPIRQ